jgi:hypothetical protein
MSPCLSSRCGHERYQRIPHGLLHGILGFRRDYCASAREKLKSL